MRDSQSRLIKEEGEKTNTFLVFNHVNYGCSLAGWVIDGASPGRRNSCQVTMNSALVVLAKNIKAPDCPRFTLRYSSSGSCAMQMRGYDISSTTATFLVYVCVSACLCLNKS